MATRWNDEPHAGDVTGTDVRMLAKPTSPPVQTEEFMSEHTPGPWTAMRGTESTGRQVADWAITVDERHTWICTGPTWDEEFREESFANARLIAAAPELLEALVRLMGETTGLQDALGAANQARAAIAKATAHQQANRRGDGLASD